MTDIVGPANAVNAVTVKPADGRSFGAADSFFQDCTSPQADDGTEVRADFLNGLLDLMRAMWRMNGSLVSDPAQKVVPEVGTDAYGLAKAIQHLVQRGQTVFAQDTGTANAIVAALTPVLREYKAGISIRVAIAAANTGPTTINVNGLGSIPVVYPDGSPLRAGALAAGAIVELACTATAFQLMGAPANVLSGSRTYYVSNGGSDGNVGDAAHPFATIQKAFDTCSLYNLNGYSVDIVVAAGTFAPATGGIVNGTGTILVTGAGSSTLISSASGPALTFLGKNYVVDKVKVQSSADSPSSPGSGIVCSTGGQVEVKSIEFGPCYNSHMSTDAGGTLIMRGPFVVSGNAQAHMTARGNSLIYASSPYLPDITFANAVTFSVAFAYSMHGEINVKYDTISGAGSVSGPRYLAIANGIIVTFAGPTYLPGNAAGSASTGGQYL